MKIALGALCIITAGLYTVFLIKDMKSSNSIQKERQSVAMGVEMIKELEKQDVVEIEEKIATIQSQYGVNQNNTVVDENSNTEKVDYKSKFSSTVIVGDSRAEGIVGYGYLTQASVVAYKGRNIVTAEKNGDINKAIGLYPKNMIFTYGINDIECYPDSQRFIESYEKVINKVKQSLPNTSIYVCSIFPVQSKAVQQQPYYAHIQAWNEDLKVMCSKLGVTYLDINSIVEQTDYEQDGVHFIASFQKKWLDCFIQNLGL